MKEIKLPYESIESKIKSNFLQDDFQVIYCKWVGKDKFSHENFMTLAYNFDSKICNNNKYSQYYKMKILDGSFHNYDYIKRYINEKY